MQLTIILKALCLSFLLLACDSSASKNYGKKVSFFELLPNPSAYDGQVIWIEGYLWFGKEHIGKGKFEQKAYVFYNKEALTHRRFYEAVELDFEDNQSFEQYARSNVERYVYVVGTQNRMKLSKLSVLKAK
ncbi:hypothetical protein [Pseudoalteromonas ardens]|uniref:Uncharacterized protein n=1 Tax=Pseudoalteromonas rubra TaxID=43658 RepID=A0A0L0EMV2_9GAMM|nr:hypothetical protein [Pseudoalteromonas sp. R96]KNC65749.1 hypothetical protein AC626_21210 [Pseudoalteromonas rubra]MDK1310460.1 hypothetical protein [Pseudoalteromonas sp. R96]